MHAGLAKWYETRDPKAALDAIANYHDWRDPEDDDFRTQGRALTTMAEYIAYYGNEENWFGNDVLLTETPFELRDEQGFRYGGRIDLIVKWHGEPWVLDHKTTSRYGGEQYYDQYRNSPQMTGYAWGGSALHGQPVKGVIVNVIVIHKIPKPAEQMFHRRPLLYDPRKVDEWRSMRVEAYNEIAEATARDYYRPRWDNCVNKYGKCQFFDICTLPAESRERALEQDFIQEEWNWMMEE